jgi:hypothetical protein
VEIGGDNDCLGSSGYLRIERIGIGGRDRKGEWGERGRSVRSRGSRVLCP